MDRLTESLAHLAEVEPEACQFSAARGEFMIMMPLRPIPNFFDAPYAHTSRRHNKESVIERVLNHAITRRAHRTGEKEQLVIADSPQSVL